MTITNVAMLKRWNTLSQAGKPKLYRDPDFDSQPFERGSFSVRNYVHRLHVHVLPSRNEFLGLHRIHSRCPERGRWGGGGRGGTFRRQKNP